MVGDDVWAEEGGETTVVIGLVVTTVKVEMGSSVTLETYSYQIAQEADSRVLETC